MPLIFQFVTSVVGDNNERSVFLTHFKLSGTVIDHVTTSHHTTLAKWLYVHTKHRTVIGVLIAEKVPPVDIHTCFKNV